MCGEEDGGDVVGPGESDVVVVAMWRGGEGRVVEAMRFAEHCEESGVGGGISCGGCGIYGKRSKFGRRVTKECIS